MIIKKGNVITVKDPTPDEIKQLDSLYTKTDEGVWLDETGQGISRSGDYLWIARPNENIEQLLDSKFKRVEGELKWYAPITLSGKAVQFLTTVTSSKVDDETVVKRLKICKACPGLKVKQNRLYCGLCGCGYNRLAELHNKLRYSKVKCPLKRF